MNVLLSQNLSLCSYKSSNTKQHIKIFLSFFPFFCHFPRSLLKLVYVPAPQGKALIKVDKMNVNHPDLSSLDNNTNNNNSFFINDNFIVCKLSMSVVQYT